MLQKTDGRRNGRLLKRAEQLHRLKLEEELSLRFGHPHRLPKT